MNGATIADEEMTGPTIADRERLRKALEDYFESAPRSVTIIKFLFEEFEQSLKQKNGISNSRITVEDIKQGCPSKRSRKPDATIPATMSKLYKELNKFFQSEDGALHPWRIIRPRPEGKADNGNFALWFERNTQPRPTASAPARPRRDLADAFWRPYIDGPQPVYILYPELRSIMDLRSETYFRNAKLDRPKLLKRLRLKDNKNIQLSYSFVSSGLVAGMLTIIEYLTRHPRFRFEIKVIRPHDGIDAVPTKHNCILFGTALSTELLTNLESPTIRTEKSAVIVRAGRRARRYRDRFKTRGDIMIQTKFGVLTRRQHPRYPVTSGPLITILAGKHGRAIEAMARFLTNPDWMLSFQRMLGRRQTFPRQLQSLFEVTLEKARNGTPVVQGTKLLDLPTRR